MQEKVSCVVIVGFVLGQSEEGYFVGWEDFKEARKTLFRPEA